MPISIASKPVIKPEWKRYTTSSADISSDPSSLIVSTSDSGTVSTVNVDRNKGVAVSSPASMALWAWDTGFVAQDDFVTRFNLEIMNAATMASGGIIICAGLSFDLTALNTHCRAIGMDYFTSGPRYRSYNGSSVATSGNQAITYVGCAGVVSKGFSSAANSGNSGYDTIAQAYNASGQSLNFQYSTSSSFTNAPSGTSKAYFILMIGTTGSFVPNIAVQFKLDVHPWIKR